MRRLPLNFAIEALGETKWSQRRKKTLHGQRASAEGGQHSQFKSAIAWTGCRMYALGEDEAGQTTRATISVASSSSALFPRNSVTDAIYGFRDLVRCLVNVSARHSLKTLSGIKLTFGVLGLDEPIGVKNQQIASLKL